MTYENIYQKFMIEYDKAGITSSYPSLTEYEAATILDKAYLALIAQKVTGNNVRRSTVESDVKSVSDLLGLLVSNNISEENASMWPEDTAHIKNACIYNLPNDFLYFVSAQIKDDAGQYNPVKLIPHESAEKFYQTKYNKPWIKIPVCYIQSVIESDIKKHKIVVLYDNASSSETVHPAGIVTGDSDSMYITYIKEPNKFANMSSNTLNASSVFECNDSVAEELISLAVTFALENVESSRLNTKLNTRGLEA